MSAISFPPPSPALVVFGRDQAGKPHASWFDQSSAELATKAAAMMNMQAVPVETEVLRDLAGKLPRRRVFSSGRAFTPFVNGKLYTTLVELTRELLGLSHNDNVASADGDHDDKGGETPGTTSPATQVTPPAKSSGASGKSSPKTSPQPTRTEEVGLGSLVLVTTGPAEGWYEAEVIGINGGMFTLKFRDFTEPTVVRRIAEIGYLPAKS